MDGKVNLDPNFEGDSFEIFVADVEQAAVKADPVVEVNGMRIWIQPLRPEDYNLDHGMRLNDFLDLIGVLNDPARQAVVNGYRLQEGTEILTEQGIVRLDGNMLLVEALDLVGYERTPSSLLLQYHGIEPCILVVDVDNQINPQRIYREQVANINERILEQFHMDMNYLLDPISEFYILRNVQPYQKINFYRNFLQVFEQLKLDLEYTFNLPISDIIYNKLLNSLPTDPQFEFTLEEWRQKIDEKVIDQDGQLTNDFVNIVDLCLKEIIMLNLIELSDANEVNIDNVFTTLENYLENNMDALIEELSDPKNYYLLIAEVKNQIINNLNQDGFPEITTLTQEYFDIANPNPHLLNLMDEQFQNILLLKDFSHLAENNIVRNEINFLCDFVYRMINIYSETAILDGLNDLPVPGDKREGDSFTNNFLKMQGPNSEIQYSINHLRNIFTALGINNDLLKDMLFDQKSFFRILRQKIQQASQNEDLDQEIKSILINIETNLGDLDFNGNDGFTNDEEMLLKILDEELNNLFGYVGYSLLQLGLISIDNNWNLEFKAPEDIGTLIDIIRNLNIHANFEINLDGANNMENVANLILSILLSGHYKTYTIVDETGKVIKQKQKYTHPGRNFLGNLFENYRVGIKNPLYHIKINEIFTKHFIYTRHFVNFFRLSQLYDEKLFFRLPPGTQFSKAKTIGIVESKGGERLIDEDNNIRIKDNSRIFWLELGNQIGGFEHILYDRNIFGTFEIRDKGHLYDFAGWGGYYTTKDVATLILNSIKYEGYISQIGESGLEVLTFRVKTNLNYFGYFQVIVSNNGYIITAHPIKDKEGNKIFGYN